MHSHKQGMQGMYSAGLRNHCLPEQKVPLFMQKTDVIKI